jgi:hypothetical protein
MRRKEFLKKAGVGTLALGSLPLLADVASADDGDGEGRRKFYFQALSRTPSGADVIVMSGAGRFRGGEVDGGGEFVHFNGAQLTTPSSAFIATGGWRAVELVSWDEVGTWGRAVAGILTVRARLKPCERPAVPATLTVACNLGPAGISTGLAEGYTLTLPDGTTFSPFGAGLTFFTRPCEESEDD